MVAYTWRRGAEFARPRQNRESRFCSGPILRLLTRNCACRRQFRARPLQCGRVGRSTSCAAGPTSGQRNGSSLPRQPVLELRPETCFPRLFALGGVGVEGGVPQSGSASAFHGAIWSFGPGAYWPLLDFGRLDALVNVAEFQSQGLAANYKKAIVVAVEEVNQAVKQYLAELERLRNLGSALQESRRAVELAQGRYDRGMTDFLNVLDAERQQYALRDQYATQQETVAVQFIVLYKALGGGWELYQGLPRIPQPRPAVIAMFDRLSHPRGNPADVSPPADGNAQ